MGIFNLTTEEMRKRAVWNKGRIIPGQWPSAWDPAIWRWDAHGNVIKYEAHGDRSSPHGWEIDHILPTALGGADDLSNLRPLHCKLNAGLGGLLGNALKNSGR